MQKTDLHLLAIAFFLLLGLLLLSGYRPFPDQAAVEECGENSTRKCYAGNCIGEQRCVDGHWGVCRLDVVCIPGTIEPCVVDYCARTYKICNECGSGYSECMPRGELPFAINPAPPPP